MNSGESIGKKKIDSSGIRSVAKKLILRIKVIRAFLQKLWISKEVQKNVEIGFKN